MFSQAPVITEMGYTLLVRAAGGEKITFTKFQVGSGTLGEGETPQKALALKRVVIDDIPIQQAENTEDEGYIQLTASFDNQKDVMEAFYWTEMGLIAEDEDGNEYLYAYGYESNFAELMTPSNGDVLMEQNISVIVAIGESENVTANVIPVSTYAGREEFLSHKNARDNPHEVSCAQIGAAPENHTHTVDDITGGPLPVAQGGTGVATLDALKAMLSSGVVVGTVVPGNDLVTRVNLGFQPRGVLLAMLNAGKEVHAMYLWHFAPGKNIYNGNQADSYGSCDAETLAASGLGGAAVTETGFLMKLGTKGSYSSVPGNVVGLGGKGYTYFYAAYR